MSYRTSVNIRKGSSKSQRLSRFEAARKRASSMGLKGSSKGKFLRRFYLSERNGRILKKVGLVLLLVTSVAILVGGIFMLSKLQEISKNLPDPSNPFKDREFASVIYDRNGRELHKVFNEYNRDPVDINQIPQLVQWVFLAAEDSEFYDHPGFDVKGILNCGFAYVRSMTISCGASTITQQTLKLTDLYKYRGVERKIMEVLFAIQVERMFSKQEILQLYLTMSPFGSNLYGLPTGSDFYFGKKPADLTLGQAIILAAVINDPNDLSPTLTKKREYMEVQLYQRANYILGQLQQKKDYINRKSKQVTAGLEDESKRISEDIITDEVLQKAREELEFAKNNYATYYRTPPSANRTAGHFVDYVIEQLRKQNYKNGEEPFNLTDLQTGGYKIYTTLDLGLQEAAERYVKYAYDKYTRVRGAYNLALMTSNPNTGEILTMVGSRDFNGTKESCDAQGKCKFDPQVNVLNTLQSAGSSMKMMGYYLAYSEGLAYPGSIVPDIPVEWGSYKPRNVDGKFNGFNPTGDFSTARNQLKLSRNLPALQILEGVGVDKYVQTAQKFGYTTIKPDNTGRSVILGGTDVYPVEHVQAFGIFATGGYLVKQESVLKIEDRKGTVLYEHKDYSKELVGDPQGIYILNSSSNNMYNDISWDGRDVAGKTGTTERQRDLIMMLYSPDFVTMGWVGNSDNSPIAADDSFGGTTVKPWVVDYMKEISSNPFFTAKTKWSRPGGIINGGGPCPANDPNCTSAVGLVLGPIIQNKVPKPDQEYKTFKVCVDQPDRLARPIDETAGKAMDKQFVIYKHFVPSLQPWFDTYLEKSGRPNKYPTEECNVNRNPNGTGPWAVINNLGAAGTPGAYTLNVSGTAYTDATCGTVTTVDFYLPANGAKPAIGAAPAPGMSTTNANFSMPTMALPGIDEGSGYNLWIRVTDCAGQRFMSGPHEFNVGDQQSNTLIITGPAGTVDFDNTPTTVNVSVAYTGTGVAVGDTVTLWVSKAGGAFTAAQTCNLGAGLTCNIAWRPDYEATRPTAVAYKMYLVSEARYGGVTRSQTTYDLTINSVD